MLNLVTKYNSLLGKMEYYNLKCIQLFISKCFQHLYLFCSEFLLLNSTHIYINKNQLPHV